MMSKDIQDRAALLTRLEAQESLSHLRHDAVLKQLTNLQDNLAVVESIEKDAQSFRQLLEQGSASNTSQGSGATAQISWSRASASLTLGLVSSPTTPVQTNSFHDPSSSGSSSDVLVSKGVQAETAQLRPSLPLRSDSSSILSSNSQSPAFFQPPPPDMMSFSAARSDHAMELPAHCMEFLSGLVCWCAQLVQSCSSLYPQVIALYSLLWVRLNCLPRPISSILPTNITLVDFLGQPHSFQYQYFRHWSVVQQMLLCELKECPGIDRVTNKQFTLDVRIGETTYHRLRPEHWSRLPPRSRVIMSARLARVKSNKGTCPRCTQATSMQSDGTWLCDFCRVAFRALTSDAKLASTLKDKQAQIRRSRELDVGLQINVRRAVIASLKTYSECLHDTGNGFSQFALGPDETTPFLLSREDEDLSNTPSTLKGDIGFDTGDPHSVGPTTPSIPPTRESEMSDLHSFHHVSLRFVGQVYDAARQGNAILLETLLDAGYNPVLDEGPLGHPN